MKEHIYFEDIPKVERKQLAKEEFRKNASVRLWSALACGMGVAVGVSVAGNTFPDRSDWPGQLLLGLTLCVGLSVLFHEALVKPKIIRLVEKRKNQDS
ncbi:MAG: hypothetical protein ACLFUS_14745 [Candidatus Sumerlaeia bacterium]